MNADTTDIENQTALDVAMSAAENWRTVLLAPILVSVAVFGFTYFITPTYVATARILPPLQQPNLSAVLASQLGALAGIPGASALKTPADQYVGLLKSRTIFDAIVTQFDLKSLYREDTLDDARNELEKRTKIWAGLKDGLIVVEVEDANPQRAADMANTFVSELRRLTNSLAITEAGQRRLFFQEQLVMTKDHLIKAEVALRSSGVSEAALKTVPQSALEALARLKAQIASQEIKLAAMRTFMTRSNPELKIAVEELTALRGELAKAEQADPGKSTARGSEYIAKYREYKYNEALFELMAKQYELARLDEAREGAVVQLVDAALPPEKKAKPRRGLIAGVAALLSLFLTILLLWVRSSVRAWRRTTNGSKTLGRVDAPVQ
jgi:tyrosine-protein kinase Etk/Wzc